MQQLTLLEVLFKANCLGMCVGFRRIVLFRIRYHQTEICLESEAILVHPFFQFGSHCTQIDGVLDDLIVARAS